MPELPPLTATTDAQRQALAAAREVAATSLREKSVDWVATLGTLTEVFDDPELHARYERGLAAIGPYRCAAAFDRLEEVVKELRARDCLQAALQAARALAELFEDNAFARSMVANCARAVGDHETAHEHLAAATRLLEETAKQEDDLTSVLHAARCWAEFAHLTRPSQTEFASWADGRAEKHFARAAVLAGDDPDAHRRVRLAVAKSRAPGDPAAALTEALALLDELADRPAMLANSELGWGATELALQLLLARREDRALAVQQRLVAAKLALYGECPATWLERHNLGTVHLQLGDITHARALIEPAYEALRAELEDDHPQVRMCKRSLARLTRAT
jgi:tetratricopeptide (TPR) repeat protein